MDTINVLRQEILNLRADIAKAIPQLGRISLLQLKVKLPPAGNDNGTTSCYTLNYLKATKQNLIKAKNTISLKVEQIKKAAKIEAKIEEAAAELKHESRWMMQIDRIESIVLKGIAFFFYGVFGLITFTGLFWLDKGSNPTSEQVQQRIKDRPTIELEKLKAAAKKADKEYEVSHEKCVSEIIQRPSGDSQYYRDLLDRRNEDLKKFDAAQKALKDFTINSTKVS